MWKKFKQVFKRKEKPIILKPNKQDSIQLKLPKEHELKAINH